MKRLIEASWPPYIILPLVLTACQQCHPIYLLDYWLVLVLLEACLVLGKRIRSWGVGAGGGGEEERRAQVHSHLVPMEQQEEASVAVVPSPFGPRDQFCGRQSSQGLGAGLASG